MLKKNISKIKWHAAWLLLPILLFCNPLFASSSGEEWLEQPVSLKFHEEPRDKVLEKISSQTGIAILYDEELAAEKVSGNFHDVKAIKAITRLFAGKNKSLSINETKKIIIVKHFGAKHYKWASGDQSGANDALPSPDGMTVAELNRLHALQYKEYKKRMANDNEVIDGGMTLGEVHAMQEQQYHDYQARLENDDEILEGGMTRGEQRTMHEKQYKKYQEDLANNDEVLESGMTRSELRTMHKQQYKEYQTILANDDEVLEDDMTSRELRTMHEQQYKEYKKNETSRVVE